MNDQFRGRSCGPALSARRFVAALVAGAVFAAPAAGRAPRPLVAAAADVARWLESTALDAPHGRAFPADAEAKDAPGSDLATGAAGHLLFLIELRRAGGDRKLDDAVRARADYVLASLPAALDPAAQPPQASLYYGVPGMGFALDRAFEATGDRRYRDGALRCVALVHGAAKRDEAGVTWGRFNDVLFGDAGTGLFLLYAARAMRHAPSRDLAADVGRALVARASAERGGLTWRFRKDAEVVLPNFSHGTAGVAYFLTALYRETGRREFLDAALAGARYLEAVAKTDGGAFLVPYGWPNPEWKDLYDVGWAHGPAGTARLFHALGTATGDARWPRLARACAEGVRRSGLPGPPRQGFGTEPFKSDMRFGAAGVAVFYADMYRATGEKNYLDGALAIARDLLARGTRDGTGLRWVYARYPFMEKAGAPAAFTGYLHGAAGFGLTLLACDAAERGRGRSVRLPDDPFGDGVRQRR
jgi:lantibiotic modifying enzyme